MGFIKDYLSFTRKERTGIISLLSLIVLFSSAPFFFPYFLKKTPTDSRKFETEIASLQMLQIDSSKNNFKKRFDEDDYSDMYQPSVKSYTGKADIKGELFYFDPNTATFEEWKRLGINEKTAGTILKYISKGGKFYNPEDIRKIWGIREETARRLIPFVRINQVNSTDRFEEKKYTETKVNPSRNITQVIEINSADTSALIALPGIGSKLSQRIIAFRDRLGGFYKVEQIAETFGLPDSTFQKIRSRIKIDNSAIKKIDINKVGLDELKAHPYFKYALANTIIQFRNQHGKFSEVSDIRKIMVITDEIYNRIYPYLKTGQ